MNAASNRGLLDARAVGDEVATTSSSLTESAVARTGRQLSQSMIGLLESAQCAESGPVEVGRKLGIDKVLASRVLKSARSRDPVAAVFLSPGPEPLRRLIRSASRRNVEATAIARAQRAVDQLDQLIQSVGGDRSGLDAIISAWVPQARSEFELRRKQAAFKAMSQLKGAMAQTSLASALLHPADDGKHLDIVWVSGLLGLQRLRPGAAVKFATRRIAPEQTPRRPMSLDRVPIEGLDGGRLDEYCSSPPPHLDVQRSGEVVHYTLAGEGFGPRSAVDLVFAEVNLAEIPRFVPRSSGRLGYVFADVSTPVKILHFDVIVHEDVYPGSNPSLYIYDTAFDGVADVNDRARDMDRLDMDESIQPLGEWASEDDNANSRGRSGGGKFRSTDVPDYVTLLRHVGDKLNWTAQRFRGYRCRIEYPIYGSQVVMAFKPPEER